MSGVESSVGQVDSTKDQLTWGRYLNQSIGRLTVLGAILLFSLAVLEWLTVHWTIQLTHELRVQQLIAAIGILSILMLMRKWWLSALVTAVITIHLILIIPAFVPPHSKAQTDSKPVTLMLANVLTENLQHDLIVKQIVEYSPDVIAIVELSSELDAKLSELDGYDFHYSIPQDNGNYGIGIYSKLPLENPVSTTFQFDDIPTIAATVKQDGYSFQLIATHPLPPIRKRGNRARNQHLDDLVLSLDQLAGGQNRIVMAGDFNLTPWSPVMNNFLWETNLRRAGKGFGMEPTWYIGPTYALD